MYNSCIKKLPKVPCLSFKYYCRLALEFKNNISPHHQHQTLYNMEEEYEFHNDNFTTTTLLAARRCCKYLEFVGFLICLNFLCLFLSVPMIPTNETCESNCGQSQPATILDYDIFKNYEGEDIGIWHNWLLWS